MCSGYCAAVRYHTKCTCFLFNAKSATDLCSGSAHMKLSRKQYEVKSTPQQVPRDGFCTETGA